LNPRLRACEKFKELTAKAQRREGREEDESKVTKK
jgi:hypothetical protein